MSEPIVGIDLGTTNSEIAIIKEGMPLVIEDDDGDAILPSFVGVAEDGKLIVGKAARNQYILAPERTVKSIKRKMGQDVTVTLGDKKYRPQEISAMILKTLKDRAQKKLGMEIKKAVITVPAYFNEAQRQATREAGEIAGLEVVRILNEPTAASLTYDSTHKKMEKILVYDLGGGTFDVSIVQAQDGVIEVLASHGDTQLGGDDFDDLLLKHVLLKFQSQHGIDLAQNPVTRARLLRAVEDAKKQLSSHPFAKLEEEFIAEKDGQALHMDLEISRTEYEELINPLLMRTMDSVQKALDDSKLMGNQIDRIVLVGGSTRTPMVSRLLEERLKQQALQEVNPDLCVAMGAAVQAALISGQNVGAILVDITPHSLGIKVFDPTGGFQFPFLFSRILHRNTPLPATKSEVYSTVHDNQEAVNIEVFQGENDDVRNNHRINQFTIEGLRKVQSGNQILVQFELNLDGMLKITAREKATGLVKQVTIENALARMQDSQLLQAKEQLNQLWDASDLGLDDADLEDGSESDDKSGIHWMPEPAQSSPAEPVQGQREMIQAKALLEKAERLLEKINPEDRSEMKQAMEKVQSAITQQKLNLLAETTNQLSDMVFYLEDA